jgi:long-chain fatty acid transport protein
MPRCSRASLRLTAVAVLLAGALAPRAGASGFQLRDQSGSGQGNAYAGVSAGGADVSSMFFNPAAMAHYQGNHLQIGFTSIAPSSKFSDGVATRSAVGGLGIAGSTISGATTTGNVTKSATIPTLYAMWSVDEDLKVGLSVNVPFGLTTEYDPNWAGRYHAVKSHLETLDITPSVSYRMDPKWSVGLGLVARHAKAELSQMVDLGAQGQVAVAQALLTNPTAADGAPAVSGGRADALATVKGDCWAYGFKLGLLYEASEKLRLGLAYQSPVRATLKGDVTFDVPTAALNAGTAALKAANPTRTTTVDSLSNAIARGTANGSASAVLKMPATVSLGAVWDVSPTVSLAGELAWTKWSSFHELRVQFSNSGSQPDSVTEENWKDTLFLALGATWHPAGAWTYRLGAALDKSPVPDATRTPRIPDADRTWASAGVSYQFNKTFGIDAGYSHLFVKKSTINLQGGSNPSNSDYFRGDLSGTYKNSIDILSVQARIAF